MPWKKPSNNQSKLNPWNKKNKKFYEKVTKIKLILFNYFKKLLFIVFFNKNKIHIFKNMKIYNRLYGLIFFISIFFIFFWVINSFYFIKSNQKAMVVKFGKFSYILEPGLSWQPKFINKVYVINMDLIKKFMSSGIVLTIEKNIIKTKMQVEYKINNPVQYYFFVVHPDHIIQQISDSVLNNLSNHINMNDVLINHFKSLEIDIKNKIQNISNFYKLGIEITDVHFLKILLPKIIYKNLNSVIISKIYKKKCIYDAEQYSKRLLDIIYKYEKNILQEFESYKIRKLIEIQDKIYRLSIINIIKK
ncbi:Modulator of FtsH protease HflK [Buchnera aphidicola (Eriosoma grossulariae)]|uniref:SPFH domain-containing protein n=1 Tax=Buchnera aphidicola TaxID=9 RepID=UPI003463A5D9